MLQAVRYAKASIDIELFRLHPGHLSRCLIDELIDGTRRGVRVRLIVDAVGSRSMPAGTWRVLTAEGIQLRVFAKFAIQRPVSFVRRNHRKILLIDGGIGFVGGMSFDDVFYRNPEGPTWRESMVRVEGPVLKEMALSFQLSWQEAGGEVRDVDPQDVPTQPVSGDARARFMPSSAARRNTHALFLAAIESARYSVYITNPFVLPDADILSALKSAASKGVDVQLIVPGGPAFNRFRIMHLAMNDLYDSLLAAGMRIFEYQPSMLHAKTIIIDGAWCCVGSSNLDVRSLRYNHEADIASCDSLFVDSVCASYRMDVAQAEEVILGEWRTRRWTQRLKECLIRPLRDQL